MNSKYVLQIEAVSHAFKSNLILKGISISVEPGQIVCVLGPSGCGKTTLLRIIAGLLNPKAGRILIDGKDQLHVPSYRRYIGFVFQDPALFPHLNVFQNVAFPFTRGGRAISGEDWHNAVAKILDITGLQPYAHRSITSLSGGQRQRVSLARALVYRPSLLLLDEPLSSLDNVFKTQLLNLLLKLHSELNVTFLYVTHDEREAVQLATHIAVIDDQHELRQYGKVADVIRRPSNRTVAEIVGGWNILRAKVEFGPKHALRLDSGLAIESAPEVPDGSLVELGLPVRTMKITDESAQLIDDELSIKVLIVRAVPWYEGWLYQCALTTQQGIPLQQQLTCFGNSELMFTVGSFASVRFRKEDVHVFKIS